MGKANLVVVGGVNLGNIQDFSYRDLGKRAERKSFAYDAKGYVWMRTYSNTYKELTISGMAEIADCEALKAYYVAETTVSVTDMYNVAYSNCQILSFDSKFIKALGAASYTIQIAIMAASGDVFKVGGSKTYGVESCTISNRGNRAEVKELPDGTTAFVVKPYTADLYTISISGVELAAGGGGFLSTISNGAFTFTTPNGLSFKAIATAIDSSLVQGTTGFLNFSVTMIASSNSNVVILDGNLASAIVDSFSIRDNSARIAKHRIFTGTVLQVFPTTSEMEYQVTLIVNKTDVEDYDAGQSVTISLGGDNYTGYITAKDYGPYDNVNSLRRLNLTLINAGGII